MENLDSFSFSGFKKSVSSIDGEKKPTKKKQTKMVEEKE
jgi:hypothetical protein